MPVYVEKVKCKKTGKLVEKKVNDKKQFFIRTYVTDEYGNKRQITKHNKNWLGREGQLEASQEENRLKNGIVNSRKNILFSKLVAEYLADVKNASKLGTYNKYLTNYEYYIKPYLKNKKADLINNNDILEWKRTLDSKDLSTNTKRSAFITLNTIFKYGIKYCGLEQNPAQIVGNFNYKKGHKKKEMNIMTEKQFEEFLSFESNESYKSIFTILFYTGMRRGELLALTWDDIDFKNNIIHINKTLNPKLKDDNDNSPKTDKSNRDILMLNKVKNAFTFLVNQCYVTPSKFVTLTTLKRHCDCNYSKISTERFRIHDFRHSFASMCINKNVPISIISDYLGHENITTTLNIYAHLYPNSQNKLIEILDNSKSIKNNNKIEFIDYIINVVNECLLSGKSKEEISMALKNIGKKYLPKQDQKQDQEKLKSL